jgi:hypothetical protein
MLLLLSGVALVALVGSYVQWLIAIDPLARFRADAQEPPAFAIGLGDTKIKSYSQGKLSGEARVARLEVQQDRSRFEFFGVTEGVSYGADGAFHFSGPEGQYDATVKRLRASRGARVWNADMDLQVDGFTVDESQQMLTVPGKVVGRLWDGSVTAEELQYSTADGSYKTGPLTWEGEIELPSGANPQGRRVTWKINAMGSAKAKGDIETYTDVEATDGEVLIKAPTVEVNRKTDVLKATGGVSYYGEDANVLCKEVTVFRKEKRAVLVGDVTMLVKPEDQQKLEVVEIPPFRPTVPDEIAASRPPAPARAEEDQRKQEEEIRSTQNLRKYPVSIHAERIEYWYAKGSRRAEITGSPQAFQGLPSGGWRRAWAPKAFYDGEKETLKMVSTEGKKDTRILTSVGDDLVATWFQVSTKKDAPDEWEGAGIEGEVVVNEEEERPGGNRGNPPPPPARPPLSGGIGERPPR